MPKTQEQNEIIRESRRRQILNATLSIYVRLGYHATDMDMVASEAGLAKGLLYYYYKTKQTLFRELFDWMLEESYAISERLLKTTEGQIAIKRLMHYICGIFYVNEKNPRMMQFAMRMPFDAYAVFAPDTWQVGAEKSNFHKKALAEIIDDGMNEGYFQPGDASRTANSFWSVFVANAFEYSKLIQGQASETDGSEALKETVKFCFQGLGVSQSDWKSYFMKVRRGKNETI